MKKYKNFLMLAALYASLPIFLVLTRPDQMPLPLLIIPYLLLFLILFMSAYKTLNWLADPGALTSKKKYTLAALAAGLPVLLLLLQSLHQLSWKDIVIVLTLLSGLAWYLRRVDL